MTTRILKTIFCGVSFICLVLPTSFAQSINSVTPQNGRIYYHVEFPVHISEQTENIPLDNNMSDLVMSNLVAGSLYSYLIHQNIPSIESNSDYLTGSLFGQLLQENLQTSDYQSSSDWINPQAAIRSILLAPGQGGPYQINDYAKRLESGIGLINFTVLQKSLGYTIQVQDSGKQTISKGPDSLDNKYFGPLAAAYFQYNTLLRLQSINKDSWGPSAKYFSQCMENIQNQPNNFLDMILNAAYNAGPWADITKTYIELCANVNKPEYQSKIQHINDYTLNDLQYQNATGTHESAGSTFILYPRQVRFYLDQLYNKPTSLKTSQAMALQLDKLRTVYIKSMGKLAYLNKNNQYIFIAGKDSQSAYDKALNTLSLNQKSSLNIGKPVERQKLFQLLNLSIQNLSEQLNIDFAAVTESNLSG